MELSPVEDVNPYRIQAKAVQVHNETSIILHHSNETSVFQETVQNLAAGKGRGVMVQAAESLYRFTLGAIGGCESENLITSCFSPLSWSLM